MKKPTTESKLSWLWCLAGKMNPSLRRVETCWNVFTCCICHMQSVGGSRGRSRVNPTGSTQNTTLCACMCVLCVCCMNEMAPWFSNYTSLIRISEGRLGCISTVDFMEESLDHSSDVTIPRPDMEKALNLPTLEWKKLTICAVCCSVAFHYLCSHFISPLSAFSLILFFTNHFPFVLIFYLLFWNWFTVIFLLFVVFTSFLFYFSF